MSSKGTRCQSTRGGDAAFWLKGVLLFLLVGVICVSQAQAQSAPEVFHPFHVHDQQLNCTDCHSIPKNPASGQELSFSERSSHATCDYCHDEAFQSNLVAGPICLTCHTGRGEELAPFPTGQYTMASFSHATHVDPHGRVNKITGVRQDCVFCHKVQESDVVARVGRHPECASCHAGEKLAKPELSKEGNTSACLGCHSLEKIDRNLAGRRREGERTTTSGSSQEDPRMRLIAAHGPQTLGSSLRDSYWDIVPFNHGRHLRKRDGSAIDCVTCHTSMLERREIGAPLSLPTMNECASCHESAALVRPAYLVDNCQLCHKTITADLRPLARDGVSPSIAHTESFRRHHAEAARAADNQCRFCHTEISVNAGQDNCSGCHSAMRPRTHMVVRFNETTHGRLAAMDREACATCHTSDYCNRCHNIPPRAHIPLVLWVNGGHSGPARSNPRRCFTCHTFEHDCMECHQRRLR